MTKNERIAELERKVAHLESLQHTHVYDTVTTTGSTWRCACGRTDTHACWYVDLYSRGNTTITEAAS